jgi:hypothetical protein
MRKNKLGRRQFLRLAISRPASLPMVFVIGCDSVRQKAAVVAPALSPEESLRKLILLLGPWPSAEKERAENFAMRFLKAEHAVTPYLPGSSGLIQSLASRFRADTVAVKEIELRKLPANERELLMNLVRQLYSFIEVRFIVSNEPPWGECQANRM